MRKIRVTGTGQFHRIKRMRTVLPAICLVAFLCVGCGYEDSGMNVLGEQQPGKVTPMESIPIVNYSVPEYTPNVLVDRSGYQTGSGQRAAVKGRKLPESFELVDAETGEVVYAGSLEDEEYSAETELYSAYADFGAYERPGNYYLECEYIGRSYSFVLGENVYQERFEKLCREKIGRCKDQTITASEITQLLLAYEWYAEIFPDEDHNGIPEILEEIALWIGGTKEQPIESGKEAAYAAALAKFSFLYQKFDRKFATDCLKRASVVFDQNQNTMQKDAESFHALTELYRASGLDTYRNQIAEYKSYFQNHANFAEERGYLYGAMTYIATRQKVDVELCGLFTATIMGDGERISGLYEEMTHPVNARNNGADDLINHALELACANYIMENYKYDQVMEEFLHYLYGRNAGSVDFCSLDAADRPGEEYLILVAQMVAVSNNY